MSGPGRGPKKTIGTNDQSIPAFSFDDGVLHIAASWGNMRLEWRPFARAEERDRRPRSRWHEFWPDFRILRSPVAPSPESESLEGPPPDDKALAFRQFREEIPPRFAEAVERFQSHQWAVLKLMREEKVFRDLMASNPVLGYCLANNGEFRGTSAKIAERLAIPHGHGKQKEILAWLGFPGTPAMVKLLRRIMPEAASPFMMRCLRNALARDAGVAKVLAHQPCVGTGVLALTCNPRMAGLVSHALLSEVASMENEVTDSPAAERLDHALVLLAEMRDARAITPFRSVGEIEAFHDEVAEEYEAHKERLAAARRERIERRYMFPDPPIPGTESIEPIVSSVELKKEGKEQRHCAGSYEKSVRSGRRYFYRVLSPERATLAIYPASDGCWRRGEIRRKANQPVSHETVAHVDAWLYRYSMSV